MLQEAPQFRLVRTERDIVKPTTGVRINSELGKLFSIPGTKLAASDLLDPINGNRTGRIYVRGESESGEDVTGCINVATFSDKCVMTFLSHGKQESSTVRRIDEKKHPIEAIKGVILEIGSKFLYSPITKLKAVLVPCDETDSTGALQFNPIMEDYKRNMLHDLAAGTIQSFPGAEEKDHFSMSIKFSDH